MLMDYWRSAHFDLKTRNADETLKITRMVSSKSNSDLKDAVWRMEGVGLRVKTKGCRIKIEE